VTGGKGIRGAIAAIGGVPVYEWLSRQHDLGYLGDALRSALGAGSREASEVAAARIAFHVRGELLEAGWEPPVDPDCRAGKCGSCAGGPCVHLCHQLRPAAGGSPPAVPDLAADLAASLRSARRRSGA
jgi:hypothetical protein